MDYLFIYLFIFKQTLGSNLMSMNEGRSSIYLFIYFIVKQTLYNNGSYKSTKCI